MNRITLDTFATQAAGWRKPFQNTYYAMYSSLWNGITTDPVLMTVPIDDHLVHRGDGVFEAFKCVNGRLFNLEAHLQRLADSAASIFLKMPVAPSALTRLIVETVHAGNQRDCTVRVFLSRGPGGFSVSPSQSPAHQLYIVSAKLGMPFMKEHPEGARVRSSHIPVKPAPFSSIKSCNYMPNVLMKHEAETWGVHFTVSFDEADCLGEGATENAGIVTRDGRLLFPSLDRVLKGTTMLRVAELARAETGSGPLKDVAFAPISRQAVRDASEFLLVGTTIDVASAIEFDGKPVGNGQPGPVGTRLNALLGRDVLENAALQTPVWVKEFTHPIV
jgi:branched-subunit amino acid aminotransferase/4-amino-4-deoxychorismate lyase